LKANYIGIVAGILAFVSIALPWWTFFGIDVYLWGAMGMIGGAWFTYAAMAFAVIGGILGIVGGIRPGDSGKKLLMGAGILDILAIVIFVAGFATIPGGTTLLFYLPFAYLSYGFWLALVAAIIAFVAYAKHPMEVGTS